MDDLVTTEWLGTELGASDLSIVDSTMFMGGGDPRGDFLQRHIPGARFLDVEEVSDRGHPAPHMLPSPEAFAGAMEALGVGSDDRIVVYDNSPLRSAVRGWFMFRHFGAGQVAILDGGLGKWLSEGRPTHAGEPHARAARWALTVRNNVVAKGEILDLQLPIADARSKARFEGSEGDPRPGVAPGHIPGSRNLPYASLWNADGTIRDKAALRAAFRQAGVDPRAFVASCGSGVTANSLIFAAHLLGEEGSKLYDGSWSEWGSDPATPKEIGPAKG